MADVCGGGLIIEQGSRLRKIPRQWVQIREQDIEVSPALHTSPANDTIPSELRRMPPMAEPRISLDLTMTIRPTRNGLNDTFFALNEPIEKINSSAEGRNHSPIWILDGIRIIQFRNRGSIVLFA